MCRRILPGVGLSTDVLVGFPSETESDFRDTLEVVKKVRFDFAYMFRFSLRPGTKAADISPRVSEADGGGRLNRLIEVQNRITAERYQEMQNREYELLIEGPSPRNDGFLGRTMTNRVMVVRDKVRAGDMVSCRVTSVNGWTPVAVVSSKSKVHSPKSKVPSRVR
jgi:tRNA-2-methylthio-N6-dimethylallyladenosine synthase